ncbi:hypothetical protein [Vibrio sp. WXL103]|uniref:hypothetical protein n=1 Tax=unclassified Vibrio TaxID=2614977 RepID=UPI003EC4E83E
MLRKVFPLVALVFVSTTTAAPKIDQKKLGRIHVCHLSPFSDDFIDIGLTKAIAQQKTAKLCEAKHGQSSMFCRPEKAVCKTASLL